MLIIRDLNLISVQSWPCYEQVKEQLICTDTVLLKSDCLVVTIMLQE